MDGLTATIKIREMEEKACMAKKRIPIIGLTASALQEDKEKCIAAGMVDYLSKPVSRERLLGALVRWATRDSFVEKSGDGGWINPGMPS